MLSKYESYLKKLYYLCHNEEVPTPTGSTDNSTLANAIYGFKCLWDLRYATSEEGKRLSGYLDMVRQWRNDEAHRAPVTTDAEVTTAIKVLVAMYLFVTGNSITDLEMQEGSETMADKTHSAHLSKGYVVFEDSEYEGSIAAEPGLEER